MQTPKNTPIFMQCDVTDVEGSIKPVAARILELFPSIHGLINNAANDVQQPTLGITLDQWDRGVAVKSSTCIFLDTSIDARAHRVRIRLGH